MSRPPRNGYTVNSDSELASLDSSLIPANTPLINFDRECWGIYQPPESPVLWTPASISTQLWFDAADASTIVQSAGLMTQWTNKGTATANNATATTPQRPTYGTYQLNGLNLVSVRGSGIGMATGYNLTTPYSIVLVSRNYSGGRVVQSSNTNSLMCPYRITFAFFAAGATVKDSAITTAGQWSTATMQILGSSPSQLWYNSTDYASGTHGNWGGFNIGAVGLANETSDADIAEILVFNYSLTEIDRQKIEGYVAYKWGLTANLPSDHPYKIYPPVSSGSFTPEGSNLNTSSGFEYIPQNPISAYALTSITISTDTYSLDLSTAPQYISITLAANTTLTILNAGKYTKYFIELIPNGRIIKNFTDIFALPKQYSLQTLLTSYFGKQVLELQYVNKLYANIDYSDNVAKDGAISAVEKINWVAPSNEVLYLAFASSTIAYTGAGISTIAATVGTPSISKSRLLLGATGRLEATKAVSLNLNEVDFTISFFSAKTTAGEFGCILGSHRASSVGFYVGVAADSTLFAIFGSNVLSCALPNDVAEHSVIINRIGRVYKIFIDGVLSAYLKAADNFNNNSTEPLCIGSLKNATGTPSWTSQSWQGYLRQLTINTSASIPFSANDVPLKDSLVSTTVLLLKYNVSDADFAQYSLSRSFTSTTSTFPLIASERLSKYAHVGYTATQLEITGNVTLEAKIFNPSSNTRGAIIDVEGGFTWGIYDLKLRIIFGTFILDGVTNIPDSTVVDVAFVKSGTSCSLYLNGVLEITATTSEVMNTSSSASEFSIKRTLTQDTAVASLNTSLFRSRSWIEIAQLRVTKSVRYTGNYIPDFSYGQ